MKQTDVFDLLSAPGPYAEYADKLMLYGQFVGTWDVEVTWYGRDGISKKVNGEWHFAWILGGRGIQDVLFASGASSHQFGTTLRCYDASVDAWHITWMHPSNGAFTHLLGRESGVGIVQELIGPDPHRREHWSFVDITPDSFTWLGETSSDGGATWFLEQEMRARRRPVA